MRINVTNLSVEEADAVLLADKTAAMEVDCTRHSGGSGIRVVSAMRPCSAPCSSTPSVRTSIRSPGVLGMPWLERQHARQAATRP